MMQSFVGMKSRTLVSTARIPIITNGYGWLESSGEGGSLFFVMTKAPFQARFLTLLGLKKPGQVSREAVFLFAPIMLHCMSPFVALSDVSLVGVGMSAIGATTYMGQT